MEGNIQLTGIRRELTLFTSCIQQRAHVCVCEHVVVSLVDTCGAIMTAVADLCLRVTLGNWFALVRHVAG